MVQVKTVVNLDMTRAGIIVYLLMQAKAVTFKCISILGQLGIQIHSIMQFQKNSLER